MKWRADSSVPLCKCYNTTHSPQIPILFLVLLGLGLSLLGQKHFMDDSRTKCHIFLMAGKAWMYLSWQTDKHWMHLSEAISQDMWLCAEKRTQTDKRGVGIWRVMWWICMELKVLFLWQKGVILLMSVWGAEKGGICIGDGIWDNGVRWVHVIESKLNFRPLIGPDTFALFSECVLLISLMLLWQGHNHNHGQGAGIWNEKTCTAYLLTCPSF